MTYNPRHSAAQHVLLAGEASFGAERILTAGDGISLVDGGAGGNLTVALDSAAAGDGLTYTNGVLAVGAGSGISVSADDVSWNGLAAKLGGTTAGTRRGLNFIQGSGINLTVVDDAANDEVDVTIAATSSGAPAGAQYVTLSTDATLTSERVLVAGAGIALTDGGAGGNVTLNIGAGTGIVVNADDVALDLAAALTWTGAQTIQSLRRSVSTKTAAYTLTASDYFIEADATSAAFAVTLPAATVAGQHFVVKKTDASANAVTLTRAGTDTIDGANTYALTAQNETVEVISMGNGKWLVY